MGFFGNKRRPASNPRSRPAPARPKQGESDDSKSRLAFVLLERAVLPDPRKVVEAFAFYAGSGAQIRATELTSDEPTSEPQEPTVLSFTGEGNTMMMVMLIPIPIPNNEAEDNVRCSLSSFKDGWTLPQYHAHLVVTMGGEGSPAETMGTFTAFIAAITATTQSVGIYWGNAGATHSREFLLAIAEEQDPVPRLMLWSGVSIARQEDGRLSLLSLGMGQLGLPDLLFTPKAMSHGDAIMTLYDLLAYCLSLGKPIPAGNTVGRTADERIPVRYVPSPRDNTVMVMQVDGM